MEIFTLSLLLPLAYLSILIGSMATFSHLYRTRQVTAKLRLAPYFPPHTSRNIYLSLLHLQDSDKDAKVPDSVLRAALFARACDDIRRMLEIRTRKPALAALLQRGVVGDEIFQRLTRAEQEIEIEAKDVMAEANALSGSGGAAGTPGTWGQTIFQSANEYVQNAILREKIDSIKAGLPAEKERWEQTRESARRELLGDSQGAASATAPAIPPALPGFPAPVEQQGSDKAVRVTAGSSDEDGVIVETPAADLPTPDGGTGGGGGGKNKKKKNKK
ncbi:Translocation protein S66 [Cladophialophora chaetospira]|uniref:Translocation protein S66 n=1 Tax=Cladophialophora chaetospira TaxID=386627 RepID=A0AA39CNB0_9EURO|nr:Translocation protein S66 [Cladophialophora chaetospira]